MIWRLLICFSLLVSSSSAAIVKGTIMLTDTGRHKAKKPDLSPTAVWLEPLASDVAVARRSSPKFEMAQKNKSFNPHLLIVPVGSTVDFPNSDPIFHNAFSNYDGQIFDIGLYPPGSSRSVVFRRAGVVRIFCNIHSSMSAVIVVVQSPLYTLANEEGLFEMTDVPPGDYRVAFYHERATEKTLSALTRTIEVGQAVLNVGTVNIKESGYLSTPHLNKYGKEYPPPSDPGTYPGVRP